jgi:hypothetical protein
MHDANKYAEQAAHGDAEEAFGLILDVQAGAAIARRSQINYGTNTNTTPTLRGHKRNALVEEV